jgi:hypothetical protein
VHNVKHLFWGALPNHRVSRRAPWVPRIEIRARVRDFRVILPWKHVHNVKNSFEVHALPNPRVSRGVPWVPRIEIRLRIRDFREILPWKHVHNVKN